MFCTFNKYTPNKDDNDYCSKPFYLFAFSTHIINFVLFALFYVILTCSINMYTDGERRFQFDKLLNQSKYKTCSSFDNEPQVECVQGNLEADPSAKVLLEEDSQAKPEVQSIPVQGPEAETEIASVPVQETQAETEVTSVPAHTTQVETENMSVPANEAEAQLEHTAESKANIVISCQIHEELDKKYFLP